MSALSTELTPRVTELSKCRGYNFLTVNLPKGQWFQLLNNGDGSWDFNLGVPQNSPMRSAVLEWCKLQSLTVTQTEETSILATASGSIPQIVNICASLLGLHGVSADAAGELQYDFHCEPTRYVAATPKHAPVPVGLVVVIGIQGALLLLIYFLLQAGAGGVVRIPVMLVPLYLLARVTFIAIGVERALSIVLTFALLCVVFDVYLYRRGELD